MKPTTKVALAGAGLIAAAITIHLTTTFSPPAGWWGGAATAIAPCPNTPPGPHPYLNWTNPLPQPSPIPPPGIYYFRFDGTTRPQASASDEGKLFTALGSDHTLGAQLDQMEIPLVSGLLGPDGLPIYVYAAPYRDIPEQGHPEKTICAVYRQGNGSKAKPCPSGVTIAIYSTQISQSPQWTSGNGQRQVEMNTYCNRTPTATVATPLPPFATPTPIAVANPYADYIEQIARDGITSGCGPSIFCPTDPLTREQAAVWFVHEKHGPSYIPPHCTGIFTDVPCSLTTTTPSPTPTAGPV